jgi:hypothetical protein
VHSPAGGFAAERRPIVATATAERFHVRLDPVRTLVAIEYRALYVEQL